MGTRSYICTMCKRKFSRKWNALRHNLTAHSNLSKIVLNSTKSRLPLNHSTYAKNALKNKPEYLQSNYESQDAEDYLENLLLEETSRIDSKILKIIGQMIKPYLELEASLNYMNTQDKASVLSGCFISSLSSNNPVKYLCEISEVYRSNQGLKVIAQHLSLANNIPIHQAITLVQEAVRNSSLIHRINN
jgi:hypothetical protein